MANKSSKNDKIAKLKQEVQKQETNNKAKILKYHQEIELKRSKVVLKKDKNIEIWKNWLKKNKNKEETWYKNEINKNEKSYKDLLNKTQLKFKKEKIDNKYNYNKTYILEEHKSQQEKIQKKYEGKIELVQKKYKDSIQDLDWDYQNFIDTLKLNLTKNQENQIKKINKLEDKKIYQELYKKEKISLQKKIDNAVNKLDKKEFNYEYKTLPAKIVNEKELTYRPFKVNLNYKIKSQELKSREKINQIKTNFHNIRYLSFKEMVLKVLKFPFFNVPVWLYLIMIAVTLAAIYTNTLPQETMGAMAVLFLITIIGGEIFKRLPIWKTYIGGATMGVFFLGALLGTFHVFPASVVKSTGQWFGEGGFLNLYINILIVGSILTIPRRLILKSFSGFIFILAFGVLLSIIFALGFGQLAGVPLDKNVLQIMLPLLSAGNGGGVQPLSKMAAAYGYMNHDQYLSFTLAVSTLSNVFVIIIAALLVAAFDKSPKLSGNGKLVKKEIRIVKEKVEPTHGHVAAGLILALIIYIFSSFLEDEIKTLTNNQVDINNFAWVVIIALFINLVNILPKELKAGSEVLNRFFTKQFTLFIMAGVGLCMTDLTTFISLFENWKYITLILLMDFGLILGPFLIAKLIRFYTLESMIAAGCCMGAQGGAGALAVLSAGKRMDLVPYSQITARIGGGLVLVVAAPLFSAFVNAGIVAH